MPPRRGGDGSKHPSRSLRCMIILAEINCAYPVRTRRRQGVQPGYSEAKGRTYRFAYAVRGLMRALAADTLPRPLPD